MGLVPNLEKERACRLVREAADWLREKGYRPVYPPEVDRALFGGEGPGEVLPLNEWGEGFFCALVMGGDGTLLKAARALAGKDIPLLGVNLGRLGFLTEVEADQLFYLLPRFLAGDYVKDRRLMLEARVIREGRERVRFRALNDVVVGVGPFARLALFSVQVSGSHLGTYPADGVIVSTPTGSTAYSLAAGGPIVDPQLGVFVITPISPHTFYARPTVISKEEVVSLRVERTDEAVVTVDGQEKEDLFREDRVEVRVAPESACLMRRPGWDFYQVLREKMSEGYRGD